VTKPGVAGFLSFQVLAFFDGLWQLLRQRTPVSLHNSFRRRTVAPEVMDLFLQYTWPGNVRELRSIVRRGVFTGKSEWIGEEDLPSDFAQRMASPAVNLGGHDGQMKALSLQLIVSALEKFSGNKSQAMAYLGLTRPRFYRLLKLHGLYNGALTSSRNGHGEPEWI